MKTQQCKKETTMKNLSHYSENNCRRMILNFKHTQVQKRFQMLDNLVNDRLQIKL